MLRKFVDGLIFGAGFAVAFVVVWSVSMAYVIPQVVESAATRTKEPKFENPTEAQLAEKEPGSVHQAREYSFFKNSEERMKIPPEGGLLAMAPFNTPSGAKRSNTYQLWLTETSLWQIRTIEDKAEIEKLPRPENANVGDLDRLVREKLGPGALQSTMAISREEIAKLKSAGDSWRNQSLNGKLSITVEGVVFVLPNPYET